jgi:glyoxylase-like metal-dependent hydrolase (beta-lactamase superfamily II)
LYISKEEEAVLRSVKLYAPMYDFLNYTESEPDVFIGEGDRLEFGKTSMEILFVPGHSVGHLAFIEATQKICIGGDVLFYQSVGRWDLPGGNQATLVKSIQEKLFKLEDKMVVYPGHGPSTTIGYEKRSNPFCAVGV